jgi:ATP synthase protein I
VRLGISVVLGVGGGLLIDSWLHTSPIFTLIGVVLGIGAAMYTIWDVARKGMRR